MYLKHSIKHCDILTINLNTFPLQKFHHYIMNKLLLFFYYLFSLMKLLLFLKNKENHLLNHLLYIYNHFYQNKLIQNENLMFLNHFQTNHVKNVYF